MFSKYVLNILLGTVKFLGLDNKMFLKLVSLARKFFVGFLRLLQTRENICSIRNTQQIFLLSPLQLNRIEFEL